MNKHTLFYFYNQANFVGRSTIIAHAYMSTNQIHSTHLRGICSAQIQRKFRPQSCGRFANARSRIRKCEHTQTQIQRYTNKVSFEPKKTCVCKSCCFVYNEEYYVSTIYS